MHYNIYSKGQIAKVAQMILILVGAIVLYLFIAQITDKSSFDEAIHTCRFSVIAQVASEMRPGITGSKSPFNINCEKRYIHFYNTKVELGLSLNNMKPRPINVEGRKVNKFKALTDFTVDQVIAEELRICKYQFADGQEEVFANDDTFFVGKNTCFVCSEIYFDSTVDKNTFDTLIEYTKKTVFDESKTTYYDYLTAKSYTQNVMWIQPDYDTATFGNYIVRQKFFGTDILNRDKNYGNLIIDTSKRYYVFFEKYNPPLKPPFYDSKPNDVNTRNMYYTEQYWIGIVPADEINNYCDLQGS